jgi:hypothetical protein
MMSSNKIFTVVEKLIISAYALEIDGKKPFTAEDLVVMAWKKYSDTFGLHGYTDDEGRPRFPDSNRVFAEIMGSKPIRKRGYLIKVGKKLYQLTEAGQAEAARIMKVDTDSTIRKISLPRDTITELMKLLDSKAYFKFINSQFENITFFDMCGFLNISPRSSAIEYRGKLSNVERIIELAREAIDENYVTLTHRGRMVKISEINKLLELLSVLQEKFHAELRIILERTDERK